MVEGNAGNKRIITFHVSLPLLQALPCASAPRQTACSSTVDSNLIRLVEAEVDACRAAQPAQATKQKLGVRPNALFRVGSCRT